MRIVPRHDLLRRWRRQIAARQLRPAAHWPRDVGALGFLVDGGRAGELVELSKVLLVVVYDQHIGRRFPAIRLRGLRASRVEHGVLWGGAENARLRKDLSLCPRPGAKGMRVDSRHTELLELALRLEHRIDQAVRNQPSTHNRRFRLPRLWAGFSHRGATALHGEGPEIEALCQRFGMSRDSMFENSQRLQDGLTLYPMDWVSNQLDFSLALFAELAGLPRRQIFPLSKFPRDLVGHQMTMAYDFHAGEHRNAAGTLGGCR